jgi:hypothetical protein
LKAENRKQRELANSHLIDVLRVDLGFDRQIVGVGTISIIASPAVMTPPTVWTLD